VDYKRADTVRRKETQLILGEDNPVYKSTTHDRHQAAKLEPEKNISYKVETRKFDTILGNQKTTEQIR
jgi:hypothetical protein